MGGLPDKSPGSAAPVTDVSSRLATVAMICIVVMVLVGVAGVWSARRRVPTSPAAASPAAAPATAEPAAHGTRD